ncbi:MAG: fatty acid-binding protein DegV [Clostridiales bacterium]|nr:MAG: fatty acid-binding protein DegV [Clostridiales bacterium]
MNFEIVTDSSCNLTNALIKELGLHIMSLTYRFGDEVYKTFEEDKETDMKSFYARLRNGETATTSLATYESFEKVAIPLLESGKDILYIGFSSGLSGTYQVTSLACNDLKEKYPDRKIIAVDTLAASLGEGLLVYKAAKLRLEGKTIDECAEFLENTKFHLCHWFTVNDLFFLKKGGRVSGSTALIGTLLNIKPVMHMDNEGHLIVKGKVRGRKASLDALVAKAGELGEDLSSQTVFISHGDCIEDAEYVRDQMIKKYGVKEKILINYVDCVIGAHSGPGTVALFFVGKER